MPLDLLLASPVIVAVIGLIAVLVQQTRQKTKLDRIETAAVETKEQVTNDHDSNLRCDLDRIEAKIDRAVTLFADHMVASKRADTARDERLTNFIEWVHAELAPKQQRRPWRKGKWS